MSAILSADDLNDFISPGVACIKPVETLPPLPPSNSSLETEVIIDGESNSSAAPAKTAQISLTDCLACSGCVTSAEAVLVSLQSHAEVLNSLDSAPALVVRESNGRFVVDGLEDESRKLYIASVAPQTRASLAHAYGDHLSEVVAGRMIEQLLTSELQRGGEWGNSFSWVVDTNVAQEACLVLGADEALDDFDQQQQALLKKPILSASCPGWVCYAEKTHPHVLPHLSAVKSAQALMGTLLKTTLSKKLNIPPSRIWHLAIMPCFDKKLEASRAELTDIAWGGEGQAGKGVRDVDCVITSKEVIMLAESRGINFFDLKGDISSSPRRTRFPDQKMAEFLFPPRPAGYLPRAAGTSGGNLFFILQSVVAKNPGSHIQIDPGRNIDVADYTVIGANGVPIFKAARYYGFRNIQNLIRRLKPARPSRMPGGKPFGSARKPVGKTSGIEYAYVEVMACPGGCTNGGGQLKLDDPIVMERVGLDAKPGTREQKEWLAGVDEAYFSASDSEEDFPPKSNGDSCAKPKGISPANARDMLNYWADLTGIELNRLALTSYRQVVSDVGKDATQAERAAQIAIKAGGGW